MKSQIEECEMDWFNAINGAIAIAFIGGSFSMFCMMNNNRWIGMGINIGTAFICGLLYHIATH